MLYVTVKWHENAYNRIFVNYNITINVVFFFFNILMFFDMRLLPCLIFARTCLFYFFFFFGYFPTKLLNNKTTNFKLSSIQNTLALKLVLSLNILETLCYYTMNNGITHTLKQMSFLYVYLHTLYDSLIN